MTYQIDDVREGDVVTYEIGEPRTAGHILRTVKISNALLSGGDDRMGVGDLQELIVFKHARIIDVRTTRAPVGSLVLVDQPDVGIGLAISKGHDRTGTRWSTGGVDWFSLPNPEEALPVPAEPLRALLAAWDEMTDYQQRVWEGSSAPAPRVVVRNKVAAFIESTRAEWERAGITP